MSRSNLSLGDAKKALKVTLDLMAVGTRIAGLDSAPGTSKARECVVFKVIEHGVPIGLEEPTYQYNLIDGKCLRDSKCRCHLRHLRRRRNAGEARS